MVCDADHYAALALGVPDAVRRMIGFRDRSTNEPKLSVAPTDNQDGAKSCGQGEPLALSPDVTAFITSHGLQDLLAEAHRRLVTAFGPAVKPNYRLIRDPDDGTQMLLVQIPTEDLSKGDRQLSSFAYDWWYDQVAKVGTLVGFGVVEGRGV